MVIINFFNKFSYIKVKLNNFTSFVKKDLLWFDDVFWWEDFVILNYVNDLFLNFINKLFIIN